MNKEELENEAYAIAEATNDDGTVMAEVIDIDRHGHDAIIEVFPMLPQESKKKVKMRWPKTDTDKFKLVRLCRENVGGFEALPQLVGEEVKVDPERWNIVLEDEEVEEKGTKSGIGIDDVAALFGIGFFTMIALPILFLLLLPFGVDPPMTALQALSMLVTGFIGIMTMGGVIETAGNEEYYGEW